MAHDLGDAAVKQALLASARRSVLAVDGAKFGRSALAVVCELAAVDVLVTDDSAPAAAVAALQAAGVDVHRV
jgi:DeoR/GlpR family transcriptional regulator of sugar metabolism